MSKDLITLKKQDIALAQKEFSNFKAEQKKRLAKLTSDTATKSKTTAPVHTSDTATRLLHCSTHVGERALLTFRLTDKTATTESVMIINRDDQSQAYVTEDTEHVMLTRELRISSRYDGCPHCGRDSLVFCVRCHSLSCHNDNDKRHRCPVCHHESRVKKAKISMDFTGKRVRQEGRATFTEQRNTITHKSTALTIRKK